jgi:hypothetical protein
MKKILIIFTGFMFFSLPSFSWFVGDLWDKHKPDGFLSPNRVRCGLEHTQLDLNTGIEKTTIYTTQFDYDESFNKVCNKGAKKLADKMNNWMSKDNTNIAINMSVVHCKRRQTYGWFWHDWHTYQKCESGSVLEVFKQLKYPEQIGYNLNIDRAIGVDELIVGDWGEYWG